MCKHCRSKFVARRVPELRAFVGELRYITAKCVNCSERMVTMTGVALPLATGDFYQLHELDLAKWIRDGFIFEYENINDAIYLQDKYNL